MLNKIELENFCIFRHAEITLATGDLPVTSIVSKSNASGVSTIMHCIDWCLDGSWFFSPYLHGFNREKFSEMSDGDEADMSVALTFSLGAYCVVLKRSQSFQKTNGDIRIGKTTLFINGLVCMEDAFKARVQCVTPEFRELYFWKRETLCGISSTLELQKIASLVLKPIITREAESFYFGNSIKFFRGLAVKADSFFQKLYFRKGNYRVWFERRTFVLLAFYDEKVVIQADLSETDRLILNISITLALLSVLWERDPDTNFPVIMDDLFWRVSPKELSLQKVLIALPKKQLLVLEHDCTHSADKPTPAALCLEISNIIEI